MKPIITVLALAAVALSSCTSAYKSGQTPDDVYFSPQREETSSEYVAMNKDDDGYYTANSDDYYSDRQLRMKVQNRDQWTGLDEWYYNTDRYSYSYYDGFYSNPWTANSFWNYSYNPYYSAYFSPFSYYSAYNYFNPYYYSPVVVNGGKNNGYGPVNRPRIFNLNTYNRQLSNSNYVTRRVDVTSSPQATRNTYRYNNNYNNSRANAGDYLRNSFNNSNNNNNSRSSTNNSSNSSSSSGRSSSGSSSSGSSAPVRRF